MSTISVMLFGTFDRLHPGHEFVLQEAGKRGSVIVIVARDENVLRIKGKHPSQTEEHRMEAIQMAFPSYAVVLGDPDDFMTPVRQHKPELIILGYDQALPPGVTKQMLPCPVERLPGFEPEKYKSSLVVPN